MHVGGCKTVIPNSTKQRLARNIQIHQSTARTGPRERVRKRALRADKEFGGAARARLHDGGVKQSGGARRHEVPAHADGAGRFAKDGDARWVAAERGNVRSDPFECSDLREKTRQNNVDVN